MVGVWVVFGVVIAGLYAWAFNTASIPTVPAVDGWTMLRFIPVMMGAATLLSSLQFLGLGSITLYFILRVGVIGFICYLALGATAPFTYDIWGPLPIVLFGVEAVLLIWFAEKINQESVKSQMMKRLPKANSKMKLVIWPSMKITSYLILYVFSFLIGVLIFVANEGWPEFINAPLKTADGAVLWWAFTLIGLLSVWHWLLVWIRNVSEVVPVWLRVPLYLLFTSALVAALNGLQFPLGVTMILGIIALMSIMFTGELEEFKKRYRENLNQNQ